MSHDNQIYIIIPLYNEVKRLLENGLLDKLSNVNFNVLLVNDGSTDDTKKVLDNIANEKVFVLNLLKNVGKAEAIREGVKWLKDKDLKMFGYLDADLSTPLFEINNMIEVLKKNSELKMIMGCRLQRFGSNVSRSFVRHILGRFFATLASLMLGESVYDTQCGAKVFKEDLVILFDEKFSTRWLFDLELLFRLSKTSNLNNVCFELPLSQWEDVGGSRLKITDFIKVPFELLKIFFRYK